MSKTISAIFNDPADARHAVEELLANEIRREDISVLMSDATERTWSAPAVTGPPVKGIDLGERDQDYDANRASLDAVPFPVVAAGAVGAPGLGLMGAGPVISAMATANAGGMGEYFGMFGSFGDDRHDSNALAERIRNGAVLVAVHSHFNAHKIRIIFEQHHGELARAAA